MTNAEHTPEPWQVMGRFGEFWLIIGGQPTHLNARCGLSADARRIVACVNACVGMAIEDVETVAKNGGFKALLDRGWVLE